MQYQPEKAVNLWMNMEEAEKTSVPQFLSTHPSNVKRIQDIERWLPEARSILDSSGCAGGTMQYADEFIRAFGYKKW